MSYGPCEYCGPVCYRGAEHNARVEDDVKYAEPAEPADAEPTMPADIKPIYDQAKGELAAAKTFHETGNELTNLRWIVKLCERVARLEAERHV